MANKSTMTYTPFDPVPLRALFPSLTLALDGHPAVFFDNPGGTQVPNTVVEAVADYYRNSNANVGGAFATSRRTDAVVARARAAMADLLNAPGSETIVFGPSMTALTLHLARSLAETIKPGDEVVVTTLDHDANVAPWLDKNLTCSVAIVFVGFLIHLAGEGAPARLLSSLHAGQSLEITQVCSYP